jgi:hypothetical protein
MNNEKFVTFNARLAVAKIETALMMLDGFPSWKSTTNATDKLLEAITVIKRIYPEQKTDQKKADEILKSFFDAGGAILCKEIIDQKEKGGD